jgi:hypothetical protein
METEMGKYDILRISNVARSGEMIVFHFQVRALYNERELEELLELLERRGASYYHKGDGRFRLTIPLGLNWTPFYQTMRDCRSIELTDVTTISQRSTVCLTAD